MHHVTGAKLYEHRPEIAYRMQDKKIRQEINGWKKEYFSARKARDIEEMKRVASIIRDLNRQRKELKRKLQIGNHKLGTMSYP